jgi:AAA domain
MANVLLQDLNLPKNQKAIIASISCDPFKDASWRQSHDDPTHLAEYLRAVVIPKKIAIRVAQALYNAIRKGYYLRDPSDAAARRRFTAKNVKAAAKGQRMDAFLILGETGLGKTFIIKAALDAIPQVVLRPPIPSLGLRRHTQIVHLYVEMTAAYSMGALLDRIVAAVDDALHARGRYVKALKKGRDSVEEYAGRVLRFLRTHHLGLLVFDELQADNLGIHRSDAKRLRNFLIGLSNAGIPVVLSGNSLALKFAEPKGKQSSQLLRRVAAEHAIRLRFASSAGDQDFQRLLRGLSRCTLKSLPSTIPFSDWANTIYNHTAAIDDFVVELCAQLQRAMHTAKASAITQDLLATAVRRCSKAKKLRPLIKGIVDRNPALLRRYDDVDADYYEALWEEERTPNEDADWPAADSARSPTSPEKSHTPKDTAEGLARRLAADQKRVASANAQHDDKMQELRDLNLNGLRSILEGRT